MASGSLRRDAAKFLRREKLPLRKKQLAWRASKLRCVVSNAAMHLQEIRNLLLLSEQRFGTATLCVSSDPVPRSIRTVGGAVLI
jgi:hypothetical protein